WNPGANGRVGSLTALAGSTSIMAGGNFLQIGGQARTAFAVFDDPGSLAAPPIGRGGGGLALGRLTPNPARRMSRVAFTLPATGRVRLSMLDVQGRDPLGVLIDERLGPGSHSRTIALDRLRAGHYWLRLEWNGEQRTERMVVLQ